MTFSDLSELALRNLRQAVLRNTLTTAGIGVGVASLVAMLSLGVGLQDLAARQFRKSGLFDTVFVSSRGDLRNLARERRRGEDVSNVRPLDDAARTELAAIPNVAEVYPDIRFYSEVQYEGKPHPTVVAAIPPSSRSREAFDKIQGSFFSAPAAAEAIVNSDYAKEILGGKDPDPAAAIGKEIGVRYMEKGAPPQVDMIGMAMGEGISFIQKVKPVRIVGILATDPQGGMMGAARSRVFIPLALAESLHPALPTDMRDLGPSQTTYAIIVVRAKDTKYVQAIEDTIKKKGFAADSLLDASQGLRRFFALLDSFLGIFGSLALAVASLGIVNTLVMSILERRREIGIMKAIGASDGDVQKLFFAEAAAMGLFGGIAGVAVGYCIVRVIGFGVGAYLRSNNMGSTPQFWLLPAWLAFGAIAFSILVSLAAGLYPARRAARLDPVDALRYD
jgi:putative ABC transport system permease protein